VVILERRYGPRRLRDDDDDLNHASSLKIAAYTTAALRMPLMAQTHAYVEVFQTWIFRVRVSPCEYESWSQKTVPGLPVGENHTILQLLVLFAVRAVSVCPSVCRAVCHVRLLYLLIYNEC